MIFQPLHLILNRSLKLVVLMLGPGHTIKLKLPRFWSNMSAPCWRPGRHSSVWDWSCVSLAMLAKVVALVASGSRLDSLGLY